jgi:hypothetical protein
MFIASLGAARKNAGTPFLFASPASRAIAWNDGKILR